jgi:hypothetical protein
VRALGDGTPAQVARQADRTPVLGNHASRT